MDNKSEHASTTVDAAASAKSKKHSIVFLSVLLAVLLVAAAFGIGYAFWQQNQLNKAAQEAQDAPVSRIENSSNATGADLGSGSTVAKVDNPVDFATLQQENADIYAWIQVPGTNVNYPVVQHRTDDEYYLTHNRYNQVSPEGAIYSQLTNSTDFNDPVTLLYGHNNVNEAMFSTLHYFGNEDFFAAHDSFVIYTPDHILIYRIVSAYIYDDRHILKSFDFKKPNVVLDYFAYVVQPDSLLANTRPDTKLTIGDKIVQLSTCMSDPLQANARFLVNGVLIDDQPTY